MTTDARVQATVRETLEALPPSDVHVQEAVRETMHALVPGPVRVMALARETMRPYYKRPQVQPYRLNW